MDASIELRNARRRAGMTQADLARVAGTSQASISQYERGRKVPTVATLARLLEAAGSELTAGRPAVPIRRPTAAETDAAARTLQDVLELAALLPTRHDAELRFPRLVSRSA